MDKSKNKQVQTERGIVCVEAQFDTVEEAKAAGYCYSFTSTMLNCDLYSKTLDERGLYHVFATVKKH